MNTLRSHAPERKILDQLDEQIEKVLAEIEQTRDANFPHEETEQRFRRDLESEIERRVVAHRFSSWQSPLSDRESLSNFGFIEAAYLIGVDAVVARFMARVKANGKEVGLSAQARAVRIAKLEAEVVALMRAAEVEAMRVESDLGVNPGRQLHGEDAAFQARVMLDVWRGDSLGADGDGARRAKLPPPKEPLRDLGRKLSAAQRQ
jgi:hypothetical protein